MIAEFVTRFDAARESLRAGFLAKAPEAYSDIVRRVIEALADSDLYNSPDPERITEIDHGDYQGTLLYVIAARGYQPSRYWTVAVSYGSCSACDSLQAAREMSSYDGPVTEESAAAYMLLALHVVQGLREVPS